MPPARSEDTHEFTGNLNRTGLIQPISLQTPGFIVRWLLRCSLRRNGKLIGRSICIGISKIESLERHRDKAVTIMGCSVAEQPTCPTNDTTSA